MMSMHCSILVVALLGALFQCNVAQQVQMPEAGALHLLDEDLSAQVLTLQRNISDLWTYIYQLRTAVSQHLNHLRQHQVELEDVVHKMSHYHDGVGGGASAAHTDGHHHSGEQHSHSSEQHSHGDDHSHSGEHHSHGDEHHSHGDDHHSHSGEHSHGGDDHSHDSHDRYHDSHSHSHSHDGHGSHSSHEEGDSHHHHDHKDSHEKQDDLQQTQQGADLQQIPQGAGPIAEPVIVPSVSRSHNSHGTSGSATLKPLPLMNNYHHHHHHHHHDQEPRRNRSRVVVMPKYSEYDLYEFAVCNVQPNRAIAVEQQQEITGQVTLWQKKSGGSLNLHVRLQGFDMGDHHGHHQQTVQQEDDNETPSTVVHKHGFHVHSSGDLSNGCQSTGAHYNPKNANHGGPNSLVRHVGDLGNIECDDHGVANIVFSDDVASLKGPYSIVGKAIVIHAQPDDLGLGGNEESLRTGNAGTRLACCVIEKVDKLPIRSYKAIKTAKQYQN